MKLQAFRIKNFRSIIDTKWVDISPDNITGLIGQNEAGKTAILEALYAFSTEVLKPVFLRSDGSFPEVSCSFSISEEELSGIFPVDKFDLSKVIKTKLASTRRINLTRTWKSIKESLLSLEEKDLQEIFQVLAQPAETKPQTSSPATPEAGAVPDILPKVAKVTQEKFIQAVYDRSPEFDVFEDFSSLLPDKIDLDDLIAKNAKAQGYKGAANLLKIAGLDLSFLKGSDERIIENRIDQLNRKVTADFREFWRQKIGSSNKIAIEFSLNHHSQEKGEKAGKPYLIFWIKDGDEKLFPEQRSKGVRWFTSFYLQLKAGAIGENTLNTILLIDEPGGSLHARAQEDVLAVFEEIKEKIQLIYSTHSPYLIKLETVYRLIAVQRSDVENMYSETQVFSAHELGAASTDTLTPLFTLMGVSVADQNAISKSNNVLLEEISAFYYISAFYKLLGLTKKASFLPATGVDNLPLLANLLLGWGLQFSVVVDDEPSGRRIYKQLKQDLYGDNEEEANKHLVKLRDLTGIEDAFSIGDLKKHVLEDNTVSVQGTNSSYMKGKPKALFGLKFWLKVKNGEIKIEELTKETQGNIKKICEDIDATLN